MSEVKTTEVKKRRWPMVVLITLGVVILLLACAYLYLDNLAGVGGAGEISESYATPDELTGDVLNFLVCGVDYDENDDNRTYGDSSNAFTDVIVYVTLDIRAGTISILQIPRDSYVGTEVPTGGTCKINAVYRNSNKDSHIDALASVLYNQFGLPVDYYAIIDMNGLYGIMEVLDKSIGGLWMTVPWDITDAETGYTLQAGTYKIGAETAEFILRNRNYGLTDIRRLDTQRYFYMALYKQLLELPIRDIVKLMPVYANYVETNMSIATMMSVAMTVKDISGEDIYLVTAPGGQDIDCRYYALEKEYLARILNEHFRPYSDDIPANKLGIFTLEFHDGVVYDEGTTMSQLGGEPAA
ncbi:LCP family protein [Ruminococcaceae bacterium OttesenSCG-928-N02]|nr:LCP family protein [Ruminococcaceae bacterium OttesenSCG-928-N02]